MMRKNPDPIKINFYIESMDTFTRKALEVSRLSDGKDKSLKVIQYFLKSNNKLSKYQNITNLINSLSVARKIIRLGNFYEILLLRTCN
jgi:hypothetical protein